LEAHSAKRHKPDVYDSHSSVQLSIESDATQLPVSPPNSAATSYSSGGYSIKRVADVDDDDDVIEVRVEKKRRLNSNGSQRSTVESDIRQSSNFSDTPAHTSPTTHSRRSSSSVSSHPSHTMEPSLGIWHKPDAEPENVLWRTTDGAAPRNISNWIRHEKEVGLLQPMSQVVFKHSLKHFVNVSAGNTKIRFCVLEQLCEDRTKALQDAKLQKIQKKQEDERKRVAAADMKVEAARRKKEAHKAARARIKANIAAAAAAEEKQREVAEKNKAAEKARLQDEERKRRHAAEQLEKEREEAELAAAAAAAAAERQQELEDELFEQAMRAELERSEDDDDDVDEGAASPEKSNFDAETGLAQLKHDLDSKALDADVEALFNDDTDRDSDVGTFDTDVEALFNDNTNHDSDVGTFDTDVEALFNDDTDRDSDVGTFDTDVEALFNDNTNHDSDVGTFDTDVEALFNDNTDHDSDVGTFDAGVDALFDDDAESSESEHEHNIPPNGDVPRSPQDKIEEAVSDPLLVASCKQTSIAGLETSGIADAGHTADSGSDEDEELSESEHEEHEEKEVDEQQAEIEVLKSMIAETEVRFRKQRNPLLKNRYEKELKELNEELGLKLSGMDR
jgi:hypothetical protein